MCTQSFPSSSHASSRFTQMITKGLHFFESKDAYYPHYMNGETVRITLQLFAHDNIKLFTSAYRHSNIVLLPSFFPLLQNSSFIRKKSRENGWILCTCGSNCIISFQHGIARGYQQKPTTFFHLLSKCAHQGGVEWEEHLYTQRAFMSCYWFQSNMINIIVFSLASVTLA